MTRRTIALLIALGACAVAFVTADATAAPAHAPLVSGEYTVAGFGETTCVPLDDVRLRCYTAGLESIYTGDLEGATTADFEQVIDCASGRVRGHGIETFTGSLHGGPGGTLTWRLSFTAEFDCATFFPSNLSIVGIVTDASGGLSGVDGVLLFDDTTYRGVLH